MQSLHISLKEMGIKIQVLCPGFVKTDFHKKGSDDIDEMKKWKLFPGYNLMILLKSQWKTFEEKIK